MATKEKNIGIEILRIISMLMVLFLHVLGQGGVYPYAAIADTHPSNHPVAWFMETAAFGAVDLFALISGYVGYKSKFKTSRYLKTWLLVSFWGVLIVFTIDKYPIVFEKFNEYLQKIIPMVKEEIDARAILPEEYSYALMPVSNSQYWYFNAYTLAYFASPLLNRAIEKLTKGQHFMTCIGVFFIMSVLPSVANVDLFVTGYGYSAIWLMALYFIGAYVAKYPPNAKKLNSAFCLIGYLLCTTFAWQWMLIIEEMAKLDPENVLLPNLKYEFIQYTSPFILGGAILLLIFTSRIRINLRPIRSAITFISSATFAVYIIHVQPIFWEYYMLWRFWKIGYYCDTPHMVLYVVIAVISLFVVCILLERVRMLLFKVLFIDKLCDLVGKAIDAAFEFIIVHIDGKGANELKSENDFGEKL